MKYGKRFTTINTDAGIKGDVAVFGYYIRSEEVIYNNSGRFNTPKHNSEDAELAAIIYALLIVSRDVYLASADVIVVNCDNQGALGKLRNNRINHYSPYYKAWQEIQANIISPIYYKWVKGHSKGKTSREWINNHIDKSIRRHYK
jgi:ribonuclease HI